MSNFTTPNVYENRGGEVWRRHADGRRELFAADIIANFNDLERQLAEARADLDFRRELYALQTKQLDELRLQRDELAARFTKLDKPKYTGSPMMDAVLTTRNPRFDAWVSSLPATYWTRYDLSAARIGWEGCEQSNQNKDDR